MASKLECIALEAIRQFKNGQLYAWINDEAEASRHFDKCLRAINAINEIDPEYLVDLNILRQRAYDEPRRAERFREARQITDFQNATLLYAPKTPRIKGHITYTLAPLASNRLELRALIQLPWKMLQDIASRSQRAGDMHQIIDDHCWQWVEVDIQARYTGTFFLSYADGILFGQIITHEFLSNTGLEQIEANLAALLKDRFQRYLY